MSEFKTYVLEYIGSSDVLAGKMMKVVEGEEREIGDVQSKGFAGAGLGFRPMVNNMGKIDIDLSIFERTNTSINDSVTAFGLVYEKGDHEGEVITEFSQNPGNDFWASFKYTIPYGSDEAPTRLKESDVKQRLVAALLKNSGIAWFADSETRPPSLRSYLFVAREEKKGGTGTISNDKTRKTAGLLRKLIAFGDEKIDFCCNLLGLEFGDSVAREDKENRIIDMVEGDPTRLVFGDERVIDIIDYIDKASVANVSGMRIINQARTRGLLVKKDGKFMYESFVLGATYKDSAEMISLKENEEIAFKLLNDVKG